MIRFTFKYLKPIAIFLSVIVLFQCCVTFNKQPVKIDQAINVDHKMVKPIKIDMVNGEKLIVDSIYYKENNLFYSGKAISREKIEDSEFYTSKKYIAEIKIDEDKISQIYLPDRPKNNIYVNICGDVSFYSINYERLFNLSPKLILAGGLGIGQSATDIIWGHLIRTIPHHITLNCGKKRSFFEFGIGGVHATIFNPYDKDRQKYFIYPIIGYRIQPLRPIVRFIFRIHGCYPVTIFENSRWDDPLIAHFGISLGISF